MSSNPAEAAVVVVVVVVVVAAATAGKTGSPGLTPAGPEPGSVLHR
jgi:hypothetical protein